MKIIAAVDIGNSTTEVCIAHKLSSGKVCFISEASVPTTGLKGTKENVYGIISALKEAASGQFGNITHICINEAAPVIGGAAMETLTQTVVTESSMLGHNPKTPAGHGCGYGKTILIENINKITGSEPYIVVISEKTGYEEAAAIINNVKSANITGAILQLDEAVLVYNRLARKIPVIDEVRGISKIKEGIETVIEVALPAKAISMLSNPYGIATLLKLTSSETQHIIPIAKSLIGAKSAVVMKTPWKNTAPPKKMGHLYINGNKSTTVDLSKGAEAVTNAIESAGQITDINGEPGTNIGDMLEKAAKSMSELAVGQKVHISDLFAVDTFAPVAVSGALAGETSLEKAIAIAAMVKAGKLPMETIAKILQKTGLYTTVSGIEPVMAALGALTTPGTGLPMAVLDLGGGSTDVALIKKCGTVKSVSLAGAGELVTMMIQSQLGLTSRITAENIKKYTVAKVESLFHIRLENGEIIFYDEGINPQFFGAVVILTPEGMIKIDEEIPIEKIVSVRQEAKYKVFVKNAMRAIGKVGKDVLNSADPLKNVILVGGSALDFEIPGLLSEAFAEMGIACGSGNIRGTQGARNAVATGLIMDHVVEFD